MSANPLEYLPMWAFFILTIVFIGVAVWGGWVIGVRRYNRVGEDESSSVGITIGALLSLLGFLLAFTFGMANNRFEERRQAVLEEANAIGTAYFRADVLTPAQQLVAQGLLREYVDVRLRAVTVHKTDEVIDELIAESERIQNVLWDISVDAARTTPTAITGYFMASINDVIDVHSKRLVLGTKTTIPVEIWICLYLPAGFGLAGSGFHASSSGGNSVAPTLALVVAFAAVLTIITDLDNPLHGMMETDQSPLVGLRQAMDLPA